MKNTRHLLYSAIAVLFALLISGTKAGAVPTASGTVITNFATMSASNFSATQSPTVYATVTAVFGLATSTYVDPTDSTVAPGGYRDYTFSVENSANDSDFIQINLGTQTLDGNFGTAASWAVMVDDDGVFTDGLMWNSASTTASTAGDFAYSTSPIAPGAFATYTLRVYAASDALDGATLSVPVTFTTTSTPAGAYYSPYNDTSYGGLATVTRLAGSGGDTAKLYTTLSGPILALTKSALVTAPAAYVALGGGATGTDPVPGAVIEYTLSFTNSGSGQADTVVITDEIPMYTTFYADGYAAGEGIMLGAVNQSNTVDADECSYTAGIITCNITLISAGTTESVKYKVTID